MAGTDEVVKVLKQALKAVNDSGVPAALRPAAFREAVRLLSSDSASPGQGETPPGHTRATSGGGSGGTGSLGALATKLGVSRDLIGEVYHIESGDIKLIVASTKLESDKRAATRQVAVLVAAGRQGAGIDADWTASKVIRDACGDLGKLDSPNFAKTLNSMGDVFSFQGKGQSRKVKVIRPGYERATALVTELTGGTKK
jgi:hypothetical protein